MLPLCNEFELVQSFIGPYISSSLTVWKCAALHVCTLFDHCHFLYSPFAYVDPLHCNMAYLYLELLKDSLNEYAYAAELAGLNYDLQNTVYGMYVSIQKKKKPPHCPHATSQTLRPPPLPIIMHRLGQCGSSRPGLTGFFFFFSINNKNCTHFQQTAMFVCIIKIICDLSHVLNLTHAAFNS